MKIDKPFGIIYKITNQMNGKIYIGQTISRLAQRKKGYKRDIKLGPTGNAYCMPIVKAMIKYGFEQFVFEEIDVADNQEQLNEKEIFYIASLKTQDKNIGYNILAGGQGNHNWSGSNNPMWGKFGELNPFYGKTHTPEVITFLSNLNTGTAHPQYGSHQSDYQKQRASISTKARFDRIGRKPPKIRKTKEELRELHRKNGVRMGQIPWSTERKEKMSKRIAGENNPKAKLNMELANQLRQYYNSLTCETVAEKQKLTMLQFQVGRKTVFEIISNRRWINNETKKETTAH